MPDLPDILPNILPDINPRPSYGPTGLEHVVYFSSVHGSGKSTLISQLSKALGEVSPQNKSLSRSHVTYASDFSLHLEDCVERVMWRVTKYWLDAHRQAARAIEATTSNPGAVLLGDRCIFDNIAYSNAFVKLGWITKQDLCTHQSLIDALFEKETGYSYLPHRVISLQPPLEWVKERLNLRWKDAPKKWHEDDFDYLKVVMESFQEFYSTEVYTLGVPIEITTIKETNLEDRLRIAQGVCNKVRKQKTPSKIPSKTP